MAAVQLFVFDTDTDTWVAWDGGSGGGGGDVTVLGGTLDAVTTITNPVVLGAGAASIGTVVLGAGTANVGAVGLRALDAAAALENLRSSALGNLGGLTSVVPGPGLLTNRPADWCEFNDPGAATLATATRLAPAAGKAHIITGISASVLAVNAQSGLTLRVLSGASVVASFKFPIPPTGQGRDFTMTGLNFRIADATACTLDFNAAPATGNFESVVLMGYTA